MADVDLPEVSDAEALTHILPNEDCGHISLPSGSEEDENEKIELPPDVHEKCCELHCWESMQEDQKMQIKIQELHEGLAFAKPHDKAKLQYDCMRQWQKQASGWRRFSAFGVEPCCQKAMQSLLQMGHTRYLRFCKALADGYMEPPEDLRQTQRQNNLGSGVSSQAVSASNVLLAWTYETMAEHLAESDTFVQSKKSLASGPAERSMLDESQGPKLVKWLSPGTTLTEIREFALSFHPDLRPPSFSTFSFVYHSEWQKWLKVRSENQHKKCNDCQKLKAWRRQCHSKADIDLVQKHLQMHIESMKADRKVDAIMNLRAQQSAKGELLDPTQSLLSLAIDGMDEAKYKIPKKVEMTHQFSSLWRPECRFVGCLAEGVTENFFIGDCDLVKDSNLDLTLVSHVIHEAQAEFERRGVPFPNTLRLHSDNATAELKNANAFKYCSWLIHRGLFREILVTQFRVGHSHGKIDQRFSECRAVLSDHLNLESPPEFLNALSKVKAREGRELNLEYIHAAVDFATFLDQLPVNVSGHTQTKAKTERGEEAVHVFGFQLRKNLPSDSGLIVDETFPDHPPRKEDVILTCRHYISSESDSQAPQVIVPHDAMAAFDPLGEGPTHLRGRREFTERQIKEFTKTANAVCQPPWSMHAASAYLLRLVTVNQEGGDPNWKPPSMTWVLKGTRATHPTAPVVNAINQSDVEWMVRNPAPVTVAPKSRPAAAKTKHRGLKRPASALEAAFSAKQPVVAPAKESAKEVSLPSGEEEFVAAEALPATSSSAAQGAPARAVVAPPPPKAKHLGRLPLPPGAREEIEKLGHSKCRRKGCPSCRQKVGLVLNADETAWVWAPGRAP